MLKAPPELWTQMFETDGDRGLKCYGQAGKPDMHEVSWGDTHFTSGLFSVPRPILVYLDGLYIDWGSSELFPNLTPLPLHGASLTFATLAASGGNIELMYDGLYGWIPIIDHLHRTNPQSTWRKAHIYDFAVLWKRAELALQEHLKQPRRYSHDDIRFRKSVVRGQYGKDSPPAERASAQKPQET